MSYRVCSDTRGDRTIYRLLDETTGASASVLPSYGFNLFDLQLPIGGKPRPLVVAGSGWEKNPEQPARHGFPVLFPFPNRIRDGRYSFKGQDYELPINKPPNAIHGFALDSPWQVVEHAADENGAHLLGRYQLSQDSPEAMHYWPTDAILELRYSLSGQTLKLEIAVSSPPDAMLHLPYGLGFHPYFRLPIEPGGDPSKTKIIIPSSEFWVLDESLPTGERRSVMDDHRIDFREGRSMADAQFDDVLTGLEYDASGHCVCRLIDESLDGEFRLSFSKKFREVVVFTPPQEIHGPGVIAVEPYTQTTDAIHLQQQGIDAGLRYLGPGERDTMHIILETIG